MILIAQKKGKRVGGKAPIEVQISEEDADLANFKWSYSTMANNGTPYIHRRGKEGAAYLSRVILGRVLARELARSEHVNFIDGNTLNCQRHNLRIATHAQTLAHRGRTQKNISGYKGVFWLKDEGRWVAEISTNKTKIRLGRFDDKHEAAKAYNAAALAYHGEFAVLNSIPSVENEFSAISKTGLQTP